MAFFGLMLCALSAGCTSPTQAEIKPVETTVPVHPRRHPPLRLPRYPHLSRLKPFPQNSMWISRSAKQRPDSTIHLLYNGGKGEMFVQNIMMKVTRSMERSKKST